ncbi:SHOCT domain-containing protein [Kitasatospora sp. NPDC049258]|uniref:SHOCT domain-containing protein n=1 Tax=Kitasatospora sp. NPDC049258 TaxID=3155394 RepID=UPI003414A234
MYTLLAETDGHWPGPWILLVPLFWLAVVAVVVTVARRAGRLRHCGDAPLAVLGRRYAEGEIDVDEYRTRRAVLTERSPGAAR